MKSLLLSLLFLTPLSCTPQQVSYTIHQGEHYARGKNALHCNQLASFEFYIHPSWLHTERIPGWNKLAGVADGHHQHGSSMRIVWRCIDGETITFAAYNYIHGTWQAQVFEKKYKPGVWVRAGVWAGDGGYTAMLGDEKRSAPRKKHRIRYALYPYFGGQDTAPHNMQFNFNFNN